MSGIKDLKKIFGNGNTSSLRQLGILVSLVVIILLFNGLTDGATLLPTNLSNVVSQNSYILILAIGMVMVIIAGHIDLSVGSVAALTGVIVAKMMNDFNVPWPLAIIAGLLVGLIIGAWQGFWVAYVGIPAFIVTLAGMMLFRGLQLMIGNSTAVPVPNDYQSLLAGVLPEVGPNTGFNNLTLLLGLVAVIAVIWRDLRARRAAVRTGAEAVPTWVVVVRLALLTAIIGFATFLFAGADVGKSFPNSGIVLIVLILLYSFLTRRTIIGRHIYAVGGNKRAAELSGVNTKRINFLVMMNMSMLAALAGMLYIARAGAAGAMDGTNWELDAIAAVFIGGAAVAGGIGTVPGSIIGGLVMAFLNNGLQLIGVGSDKVLIIKGLVLLAAVAIDVINKNSGRFSVIGALTSRRNRNGDELGVPVNKS
ncbi:putative multiple sugar transport system permease protein [Mycetocola sp. BIGb0189]|nr:putative multiple sugar transport system permease protein [Mycetocola sp. BIGb0189]